METEVMKDAKESRKYRLLLRAVLVLCLLLFQLPSSCGSYGYQNNKQNQANFKNTYNQNYFHSSDGGSFKSSSSNFYNGARDFSVCDDSVVRVRALYVVCDSPYTFYYGNGANRNSPVCTYGDKLSMEVRFEVTDDIKDSDNIFVTMAVYDDQGNMLISVDPVYLCDDLVGYECINQGYYGFIYRLRLPYPYNDITTQSSSASGYPSSTSDRSQFLPYVHMAFSTKADSGYNLGALNIQCEKWNSNEPGYVSWSQNRAKRSPLESFTLDYGILLGSCMAVVIVSLFVWQQARQHQDVLIDSEGSKMTAICLMD